MEGLTLTISSEKALEDAKQIETIVQNMESSMQQLDKVIDSCIADGEGDTGILTNWSTTVKSNWSQYSTKDVPFAFSQIKESAKSLKEAAEQTEAYSNETR